MAAAEYVACQSHKTAVSSYLGRCNLLKNFYSFIVFLQELKSDKTALSVNNVQFVDSAQVKLFRELV